MEDKPQAEEYRVFDCVNGVDSSVFYIARPKPSALNTVNAADFGLNTAAADNYTAFCRATEYCRNNPGTRLTINAGTYRFTSAQTIALNGLDNILIDADGACFVFENDRYFYINNCDSLEIKGLAVDWAWDASRLGSVVRVENANRDTHSLDLVFTEVSDVSADIPFTAITQYDAQTLTPGAQGICKEVYLYQAPECLLNIEKTGSNILTVTHNGVMDNFLNGETYLLRHYVYGSNVFAVENESRNITFNGVKIYSAAGMGYHFGSRSERFQLLDCYVGLAPGCEDSRRVSATADAVHIADTNGHFRIKGCDFSFMGDDALNVHDNLIYTSERLSDTSLRVYANASVLRRGDTVVFSDSGYNRIDFTAVVDSVKGDVISFDRALPQQIAANCIMFCGNTNSGNYVITDNYFHENRARGLLLQSDNGLCENNRFYKTMGQAIKIVMDIQPGLWYEGKGVNNLVIRSNTFELCDYSNWGEVITLGTNIAGSSATIPMFSNITIENNSFSEMPCYMIKASNTSGLNITGNRIINSTDLNTDGTKRGRICIGELCSGVKIEQNKWTPSVYAPLSSVVILEEPKALV